MSVTINGTDGLVFADGSTQATAATSGLVNKIMNGAMMIDQRNAGASVTVTSFNFSVDRWQAVNSQSSKFSVQQNAGSVTPPAGFSNYMGCTSLSAYSILSSDTFFMMQKIEGYNTADFAWGTTNAKAVTLSFWAYSSLTGTFGGSVQNSANNRSYPFSYSIPSTNTWTYVTITVPGDTSGTWLVNNGTGVQVNFSLGCGSTYSGTAGAWVSGSYNTATGATSVVGINGATFYITGVQLEKGSTATSFDYRPYGTELALCQRYYQKSFDQNVAVAQNSGSNNGALQYVAQITGAAYASYPVVFPVSMRAAPTVTFYSPNNATAKWYNRANAASSGDPGIPYGTTGQTGFSCYNYQVAGDNQGNTIYIHYSASAEL